MAHDARLTVAVTGASGLIGTALRRALSGGGHRVVQFVRSSPDGPDQRRWEPGGAGMDPTDLDGVDALINLSGAGLGDHRWTDSYKETLLNSRLDSTHAVSTALRQAHEADGRSRRLLSGSGVDAYRDVGTAPVDESGRLADTFLGELCQKWEAAALETPSEAASVAVLRTGLVIDEDAELISKQRWIFKLGLGGRLGSGQQYWPVVSLTDHVRAQLFLLGDGKDLTGPINLAGPEPVTNAEVTRAIGEVIHRPTLTFVPAFALRLALGGFADAILASHRVFPKRLTEAGFTFTHPNVRSIMATALT